MHNYTYHFMFYSILIVVYAYRIFIVSYFRCLSQLLCVCTIQTQNYLDPDMYTQVCKKQYDRYMVWCGVNLS